jgi:hypothetical protein
MSFRYRKEKSMKAIEVYKKIYGEDLNIEDIDSCPDILEITDTALCIKTNRNDERVCIDCWNQEVSDKRVEWLMEAKKMCKLVGIK